MTPEHENSVQIRGDGITVDAALLGRLLKVPTHEVPELLRNRSITSLCERGVDADEGLYRLSFFHENRRLRLNIDSKGRIVRRSVVDFGERPLPSTLHQAARWPQDKRPD